MSEPVTNADKLPPEVLALLGDDATPEKAAKRHDEFVEVATVAGCQALPTAAYDSALAAAAIRECETGRTFTDALRLPKEQFEVASDAEVKHREAMDAYDALRNWRKP